MYVHVFRGTLCHINYYAIVQCAGLTVFPLPDPSTVLAASQIQFDELKAELEFLTKQIGVVKSHLAIIVADGMAPHSEMLKQRIQLFLSQSMIYCRQGVLVGRHITLKF